MVQLDAIVVTAADARQAEAFRRQLERRRVGASTLLRASSLILAVADPDGQRIGSGGATLNALHEAVRRLQHAAPGHPSPADVLASSLVLVLHSGGDSRRMPVCSVLGKGFCSLPTSPRPLAPVDLLLEQLGELAAHMPRAGCLVAASDVLLLHDTSRLDGVWHAEGVTGLAIPAPPGTAKNHGVYKRAHDSTIIDDFFQKPSLQVMQSAGLLREDGTALVDSGLVFLSAAASTKLHALVVQQPFTGCTHDGLDAGTPPFRFELYSDVLLAMNPALSEHDYLAADSPDAHLLQARRLLWSEFHSVPFTVMISDHGRFAHLGTVAEYREMMDSTSDAPHVRVFREHLALSTRAHASVHGEGVDPASTIVSSVVDCSLGGRIQPGAIVEHSLLQRHFLVEDGGYVCGVRSVPGLLCRRDIVIQQQALSPERLTCDTNGEPFVLSVFGVTDPIKARFEDAETSLFCNRPWAAFFDMLAPLGITPHDVWPHVSGVNRMLWNARLFPVISSPHVDVDAALWLQNDSAPSRSTVRQWRDAVRLSFADMLQVCDPLGEFDWRERVSFLVDLRRMEQVLLDRSHESLADIFDRWARQTGPAAEVIEALEVIASTADLDIGARALQSVSHVLAVSPDADPSQPRWGPHLHPDWARAFERLRHSVPEAVQLIRDLRVKWTRATPRGAPVRLARHYEGASQVLIGRCVASSDVSHGTLPSPQPVGEWVHVTAPARIDLSGGWSDTPPICFEHSGVVVNVAVTLNDEHPIGADARRVAEPAIILREGQGDGERVTRCTTMADLKDYSNPHAPAALLKCVVIALGIVDVSPGAGLEEQLARTIQSGLEVRVWSTLPRGTGLGVSSILAAAAAHAVNVAVGYKYETQALMHLVLHIEQLLSTGGGWQDQVGGALAGFKVTRCAASLPLSVQPETLPVPETTVKAFNQHMVLMYTGASRLARNLLQSVLQRWFMRSPDFVGEVDALCANAEALADALCTPQEDPIAQVAHHLNVYWRQKQVMAADALPDTVARLVAALNPFIQASSLCGAGGGGFLFALLKTPAMRRDLESTVAQLFPDVVVYSARVCGTGMRVLGAVS